MVRLRQSPALRVGREGRAHVRIDERLQIEAERIAIGTHQHVNAHASGAIDITAGKAQPRIG
jgi:hypothetical protein